MKQFGGGEGRRLTTPALQTAVRMQSEGLDVEGVAHRISLRDRDWGRAVEVLQRCERSR
ncbi:MAG: hypothetical protein Q8N47_00045 [Bryobacterales bacterium]|nr:hypothetical protein [Bryobacterales bacterium]